MLAVELDTTLQALGEEAFNELLQRYDRTYRRRGCRV